MTLRVSVPPRSRAMFWRFAPKGNLCWLFRNRPECAVGDEIIFRQNRRPVATAKVASIDKPGEWFGERGEGRRRGTSWWKVHWDGASFESLHDGEEEENFKPQLYGGYQ